MRKKLPIGGDTPQAYILLFSLVFVIYLIGAFLDIMDIDAAQYASISRDMMVSGEYLQVKERGGDYLDKPPLLFWMTAFAFYLFGVANFVYRIFPILSTILGAYSTYRLGKLYYNTRVGKLAALSLVSCQAYFLINHDVRTDTMLANWTVFAIWQIAEFNQNKRFRHIIFGFAGIGIAMLAKGPIGLMVPVLAFATDFIVKRQWLAFFRWQWLAGLVIAGVVLFPMCYGLYTQFDLHPEKVVNGKTGNSGLYFFFWKQSFGRLTGENDFVQGTNDIDSDPFFFVHSFLWSFLPWALVFIPAFFQDLIGLLKKRLYLPAQKEALTMGGFLLPFIALSFSHYKLPHYIYVVFPLGAIIMGKFLHKVIYEEEQWRLFKISNGLQLFTSLIVWLLGILLSTWAFPTTNILIWVIASGFFMASVYFVFKSKNRFQKLIFPSSLTIIGVNFLLNSHVYPSLFPYQTGSAAAKYMRYEANIPPNRVFVTDGSMMYVHSLDFYNKRRVAGLLTDVKQLETIAAEEKCWVYANEKGLQEINALDGKVKILKEMDRFHITGLSLPFLNPATRQQELEKVYILEFSGK